VKTMSPLNALVIVLGTCLAGSAVAGPALAPARPALQAVKKPVRVAPAVTARLTAEQRGAVARTLKAAVAVFGRDKNAPRLVAAGARLQGAAGNAYRVQATAIVSANAGSAQTVAARYGIDAAEVVGATNSGDCPAEISIEFTVENNFAAAPAGGPTPRLLAIDTGLYESTLARVNLPRLANKEKAKVTLPAIPVGCNRTVNLLFDDIANAGVYQFTWANGQGTLSSYPLGAEPPSDGGPLDDFPGGFPGLCGSGTWVRCPPGICVPGDTCGY
jgi:hypothetical protein